MVNKMDNCQIRSDPLGVVLIIGPWNYPINLMLAPLVGAIAAGNCAVLKPSEISVNASMVMADLIPKYVPSFRPSVLQIPSSF
jgi:acyl-CoA reductase-like NAD-dependent aldehyde dehydrogenase